MPETIKRIVVAVPLAAVFGGALVAGYWLLWAALTLAAAAVAAKEWGKLAGMDKAESTIYAALFALLCIFGAFLLDVPPPIETIDNAAEVASLPITAMTATTGLSGAGVLLAMAVVFWAAFAPLLLLCRCPLPGLVMRVMGMLLLFAAWMAGLLLFVADTAYLAAAVVLVIIADAAAYCCGRVYGKSLMASQVSPGKTWEGFYGGYAAVLIAAVIAGRMIIDAPMIWLLAAAFALVVLSVIGDLFASMLKRQAGVKDSGAILGAHGGVIDRIDAMLPVLPCAAILAGLPG